jgi:hypothetical protein
VSSFIGYPTGRLLCVVDDPSRAREAADQLASAGVDRADVTVLSGPDDARRFDGTGAGHGVRARILRLVQFAMMDQLPDFAWYEAAAREGRAVVVVRVSGAERRRVVVEVLERAGAHFMNYFGRLSTEELSRWRGPEPNVASVLRR